MAKSKKTNKPVNGDSAGVLHDIYQVASKTSVSVIIEGDHGLGKSESVKEYCKDNDIHLETLFLSHQEVGDLVGIPTEIKHPDGTAVTIWSKPVWLVRMEEAAANGKRTALFLDELNRAQTEVRQTALQLVLDKQIHEHKLPVTIQGDEVYNSFIVAAVNPADGDYQVDELDPALLDRFLYFRLEVNKDRWLDWAGKNGIHKTIIKFISNQPDKLYAKNSSDKLYPTPRSWAKLSELLQSYEEQGMDNQNLLTYLITGKIGDVVGIQFFTFYKENSHFVSVDDIAKIVDENWDKVSGADDEKCQKVAALIAEEIKDLEIPLLLDLNMAMKKEYLSDLKATFESAKPLICYMDALPVEQLTAFMKTIQKESEETNVLYYDHLSAITPKKFIFRKILNKIKRVSID